MLKVFSWALGGMSSALVSQCSHYLSNIFLHSPIHKLYNVIRRCYQRVFDRVVTKTLVHNLVHKIESGNYDSSIVFDYTYEDINHLLLSNVESFKKIHSAVTRFNLKRIARREEINVHFHLYDVSMWSCDELYRLFEQDNRYKASVVIYRDGVFAPSSIDKYKATVKYFKDNGFDVVETYHDGGIVQKTDIQKADIVFRLTPYKLKPWSLDILNSSLDSLLIYIPYSLTINDYHQNHDIIYNQPGMNLSWVFFCEHELYYNVQSKYSKIGNFNLVTSGYPKLDEFYSSNYTNPTSIWKISNDIDPDTVKKIIYAPHHSILGNTIGFSTFHQNYMEIYEYVKSHPDSTSWVIKPHPLLRTASVAAGVFKSIDEYDRYLDMWDELPNAKTVRLGTYNDIFATSDGMITDSVSFITEYQYVKKPLLLLTRETQLFNEVGEMIKTILYQVPGDDMEGIFNFIDDILINENDYMKPLRDEFFNKYLDYKTHNNGKLASEFIYEYVSNAIDKYRKSEN